MTRKAITTFIVLVAAASLIFAAIAPLIYILAPAPELEEAEAIPTAEN